MVTWCHTSFLYWVIETKFPSLYFFANIQWSVVLPHRTGVIFPRFSGEHEVDVEHETHAMVVWSLIRQSFFPFFPQKKDKWSQVISTPFPVMGASSSTSTSCFMRKNIACYADYKGAIHFTFRRHLLLLHHWQMFWHFPPEQIWIVFCSVVSVQQQEMALVIHSYHLLTLVLLPLKINTFVNSFSNNVPVSLAWFECHAAYVLSLTEELAMTEEHNCFWLSLTVWFFTVLIIIHY